MSLAKALNSLKFDKRLTEINLKKGHVTKEEMDQHLQSLPDVGQNIDLVKLGRESQDMNETH